MIRPMDHQHHHLPREKPKKEGFNWVDWMIILFCFSIVAVGVFVFVQYE